MSLPSILSTKRDVISVDQMTVDTSILHPINSSASQTRFVLDRKGLISGGSSGISFQALCSAAASAKCFYPFGLGAMAHINKVIMKIGSKEVQNLQDFAYYQEIFKTPENLETKAGLMQPRLGELGDVMIGAPTDSATNAAQGGYQFRDMVYDSTNACTIHPSLYIRNTAATSPKFFVKLEELVPMTKNVMLPLHLMPEVSLTIYWNQQSSTTYGTVACFNQTVASGDWAVTVNSESVEFLADYITYTPTRMEEVEKSAEEGMIFPFSDHILNVVTNPKVATTPTANTPVTTTQSIDLGVAGRQLKWVLLHDHKNETAEVNVFKGRYASQAYSVPESFNIKVNDRPIFTKSVVRESHKVLETSKVFGSMPSCVSAQFSYDVMSNKQTNDRNVDNQVFSVRLCEGHPMSQMAATKHIVAVDLSQDPDTGSAILVGTKPVNIQRVITHTNAYNHSRTLRIFSGIQRFMTLKSGDIELSV